MPGRIKNYLSLSLPRLLTFRWEWLYLLTVSIINIVMVYGLHPFGEPDPLLPHQPYLLTGFAWICILIYILLYQLVPKVINRIFKMEDWTLLREFRMFGIYFVIMVFINWVYASLVIPSHKTGWAYFGCIVCFTVMYQLLPVALATTIHFVRYFIRLLTAIKMPEEPAMPVLLPDKVLDLTAYHAGVYPLADIRFLEVDGNYTRIHYISKGRLKHDMVHLSLIKVFTRLNIHPQFVHCRVSCVVNLDCVTEDTSNSRKMKLNLMDCPLPVKVSRDKIPQIKRLLMEQRMAK
jgi:hypothetical protein